MLWHTGNPMAYTTILLDFDHTLLDFAASEREAFAVTLRNQGIGDPMEAFGVYQRINRGLWKQVEQGEIPPDAVRERRFELLLRQLGCDGDVAQMAEDYIAGLAAFGDLYPGTIEVLEKLEPMVRLALLSNGLSEVKRPQIARFGFEQIFDAIVISAEVGVAKPDNAIFDIAFNMLGNPPKETALMVGDSLSSDIKGGADYGIATCWYNPGGKQPGPDDHITHEIKALEDLLDYV
ncbi:MAG: YjjG family noncanonical pyrimidine nucleotidase [Acidimicrobiia bacterium]